ncbi:membrane-associated protein, putative [Bodo saltans]|uniref:Membrane-associated protein, putative n=1 Tax=Bodo saltans TaxID=75058 RepID=A0A0S4IX20_BODSA|nr:membrane-associated protein, putative [Bodo saltans]|eukprot:CUF86276.1 membrane-associated protein, putative [Bodo saltans]
MCRCLYSYLPPFLFQMRQQVMNFDRGVVLLAAVLMLIFFSGAFLLFTNNSVVSWNPSVDDGNSCSATTVVRQDNTMNSPQQVNRVPATFSCGVVAVCKVLSATFIVAQGGECISLRYDIAVRSPTNSSLWTAGFNASSCDAFDGNCWNSHSSELRYFEQCHDPMLAPKQ